MDFGLPVAVKQQARGHLGALVKLWQDAQWLGRLSGRLWDLDRFDSGFVLSRDRLWHGKATWQAGAWHNTMVITDKENKSKEESLHLSKTKKVLAEKRSIKIRLSSLVIFFGASAFC